MESLVLGEHVVLQLLATLPVRRSSCVDYCWVSREVKLPPVLRNMWRFLDVRLAAIIACAAKEAMTLELDEKQLKVEPSGTRFMTADAPGFSTVI